MSSFRQLPCSSTPLSRPGTPVLLGGIPSGAFQLSPSSFRVFASLALDMLHISVVNTRCAAMSRIARRSRSSVVRLARSGCGSRVGSVVPRGCAYLFGSQGNSSHEAPPHHLGQDDRRLPIDRVFMRWLSGVIPRGHSTPTNIGRHKVPISFQKVFVQADLNRVVITDGDVLALCIRLWGELVPGHTPDLPRRIRCSPSTATGYSTRSGNISANCRAFIAPRPQSTSCFTRPLARVYRVLFYL